MSDDTASVQKRVIFNDVEELSNDAVICPKSPRSPKIRKAAVMKFPNCRNLPDDLLSTIDIIGDIPDRPQTHFASGSTSPGSSKFRHKSPTSRHISPHHSMSKNELIYNWEDVKSVRKTQSTALPGLSHSVKNPTWTRNSITASTADSKVEDQSVGTDSTRDGNCNERINRRTTCYYNSQLMFLILNCIILATGLFHFGAASCLAIYKETILIIVEYRVYVLCLIVLFIDAIFLLATWLTGLYAINHRGLKKVHLGCSLFMAFFTIFLGILQSNVESNVQGNARSTMLASVEKKSDVDTTRVIWGYYQETFKCCGVLGHWDWCEKTDRQENITRSGNFLGSYTCQIPVSCCLEKIDKIVLPEKFTHYPRKSGDCRTSPTPWNTRRDGCLEHVKREIHYVGKLFRIISFGTGILLFLSSTILFFYA